MALVSIDKTTVSTKVTHILRDIKVWSVLALNWVSIYLAILLQLLLLHLLRPPLNMRVARKERLRTHSLWQSDFIHIEIAHKVRLTIAVEHIIQVRRLFFKIRNTTIILQLINRALSYLGFELNFANPSIWFACQASLLSLVSRSWNIHEVYLLSAFCEGVVYWVKTFKRQVARFILS